MNFLNQFFLYLRSHRLQAHLFFWILILLFSISRNEMGIGDWSFGYTVVNALALLITQIPAAYFLTYVTVSRLLRQKNYLLTLLSFIAAVYLITVASRIIIVYVAEPFQQAYHLGCPECFPQESIAEICTDLYKLFRVYFYENFSIAFLFLALKLLFMQNEIQKKTLSLEKDKVENELRQLKAQLNPHFLFNTLNNIYALSLKNSPKTSDAISRLSAILDNILYRCDAVSVPILQEVELLEDYLALEKLRYTSRLLVSFNTRIMSNVRIAPLILISLVENAFKHGAGPDTGNPEIHISLNADDQAIEFEIMNTIGSYAKKSKPEKIGLDNISRQLDLLYGNSHQLQVTRMKNEFLVKLQIKV